MILKKTIIDGKVVYEPISYEEALAYPNKEDLIFTSDDEKEEFEEKLDSLEEELDEMDDTIDELIDELDDEDDDQEDNDESVRISINGKKINLGKDFGGMFGNIFGNMFGGKNDSKTNNLVAVLPFMNKENIHELVEKILNNEEEYKDLNLVTVMPFLDTKDCDALFMKFVIEGTNDKCPLVAIAPFVSKKCLSELVDEYVNGNYQHVEMSTLYPFLDGKDVKKVFNYILGKKNK